MGILDILLRYREALTEGLAVTMQLAGLTWAVGIVAGTAIGVLAHRFPALLGRALGLTAFILSAIPLLVMLYWVHFPLQILLGIVAEPFYSAAWLFSLLNTVGVASICHHALNDFPKQYVTAARVCGLKGLEVFWKIQVPLILRRILPGLLTLQVTMLQMTLFASLISVEELFRVSLRINSEIYRPIEVFTVLGLFFLMICLPLNGLAWWMNRRFTRDISER